MEQIFFNGVLITHDLGYGRKEILAVDRDTGEILCHEWVGNIEKAFSEGANTVVLPMMLSRDVAPNGAEYRYVKDPVIGREFISGWYGKERKQKSANPKHTGGKPSYVKLYPKGLDAVTEKLGEVELGMLFKMTCFIEWKTGVLIDKRTKKPLDFAGLQKVTGHSEATLSRRLDALRSVGAITTDDQGHYVVSPELLRKG